MRIGDATRAMKAFAAVLPSAATTEVVSLDDGVVEVAGQTLRVAWIGEGRLGDARRLLESVTVPDVAVGRRLSPGARELLSEAGIGYVDETGTAEIATGTVLVAREGTKPSREQPHRRWTRSVLAVAEAVLCEVEATVSAVSDATSLSMGSCSNALRTLTDLGLLAADEDRGPRSGRRLEDPGRLLAAYAAAAGEAKPPPSIQVGVAWRDPVSDLQAGGTVWDDAGISWAATGPVAAAVMAPLLTTVTTADVYVDVDNLLGLERCSELLGARPVEGGRLTLTAFPTETSRSMASVVEGLRVAPWPRVYVDLNQAGVRGEEAAEHLREITVGR